MLHSVSVMATRHVVEEDGARQPTTKGCCSGTVEGGARQQLQEYAAPRSGPTIKWRYPTSVRPHQPSPMRGWWALREHGAKLRPLDSVQLRASAGSNALVAAATKCVDGVALVCSPIGTPSCNRSAHARRRCAAHGTVGVSLAQATAQH